MYRFLIFSVFTFMLLPEQSLAIENTSDKTALSQILDAISDAYSLGPQFNGFHSSDNFSFFVVESRKPSFLLVDQHDILKHFNLLIENASSFGDVKERDVLDRLKSRAIDELKALLGDQQFKLYSNVGQYGSETRIDTYYIGPRYQLWFEETWVD